MTSTMGYLTKACALSWLLVANAQSLRKGGDRKLKYGLTPIHSLSCSLFAIDAQFEDGTETEVYGCTLSEGQTSLGGYSYSVDLPEEFINENKECIRNGACYVDIPGGRVIDEEGAVPTIEIPDATELMPIDKSLSEPSPSQRNLALTGTNPVLVVRVTASDKECNPSSADLAGSVFGLGNKAITNSMKSQYEGCSNGKFSFTDVEGPGVNDGVLDVTIDEDVDGTNIFSLTNAMYKAADNAVGTNLNKSPRHLMYVVPYGTTFNGSAGWVAFAHVNGYNSWYNDMWGDRLSAQVHEVGHNLGMHHSNENNQTYRDQTGMMGFSYSEKNGPLMCFNAFKNHVFGWYGPAHEVDPKNEGAWTGELVAFVDANYATSNQEIIVQVGRTYMQLNGAKGVNRDTKEKANEVVLIEGTQGDVESNAVGSLGSTGDTVYLWSERVTVELCSLSLGSVYSAVISIYRNNQSSGCASWAAPPAPTPTPTPSWNTALGISGFTLINTDTNTPISWGSKANNMSIRAEPWGSVESVRMVLYGERSHTQNENAEPYMLNGDVGWSKSNPIDLPAGSYTIEATAYPKNSRQGWASETKVFQFTIPS